MKLAVGRDKVLAPSERLDWYRKSFVDLSWLSPTLLLNEVDAEDGMGSGRDGIDGSGIRLPNGRPEIERSE